MKQRVITAAIALVLFIPIIWIGGITIEFVAALLAVVGVYELFRMKGLTLLSFEETAIEAIDEELIADHLMTGFLPTEWRDPELVIRTSGEERISNFLLWQLAYSELYFTKALWPDFDGAHLEEAIAAFQNRDRRFGGVKKTEKEGDQS